MKKLYIIKKDFYNTIRLYPSLLSKIDELDQCQCDAMFETVDPKDLMASAATYFQKNIGIKDNTLYIEHSFQPYTNEITCRTYYLLYEKDENPFVTLLKRKFRYFFIQDC